MLKPSMERAVCTYEHALESPLGGHAKFCQSGPAKVRPKGVRGLAIFREEIRPVFCHCRVGHGAVQCVRVRIAEVYDALSFIYGEKSLLGVLRVG